MVLLLLFFFKKKKRTSETTEKTDVRDKLIFLYVMNPDTEQFLKPT